MTPPRPNPALDANRVLESGDPARAAKLAAAALQHDPASTLARTTLGEALVRMGDPARALPHLQAASAAQPDHGATLHALANAYKMLGRTDEALRAAEQALTLNSKATPAMLTKASVYRTTGRSDEALPIIETLSANHPRSATIACEHADILRALRRPDDALSVITRHTDRTDLSPQHHRAIHIRRAQLLDELARYDEAFDAAEVANGTVTNPPIMRAAPVIERWTRNAIDLIPESTARSVTPILIVGMPRSGTTLLERIISAHPQAAGVGECPALPLIYDEHVRLKSPATQAWADAAGARYLDALSQPDSRTTHVVDKMPANVLTLGLASRLLPNARVIHAKRDPRDVCLSCYLQELNASMAFTRDLEACAHQHIEIDRMMDHWRSTLTLPWCDLRYEDLVTDAEGTVRRVLSFLELPYDERCLTFHESSRHVETASWAQVTRPLYASSVGKWRTYEKHLGGMLDILGRTDTDP